MKTFGWKPGDRFDAGVAVGRGKPKALKFRKSHAACGPWGTNDRANACIALAILDFVIESEPRALRLMMRFKHRVAPNWKLGEAWSITEDEVIATIADVEKIERDTAQSRRMTALEPAPIVTDRGADLTWTKEPKLVSNLGRKS